MAKRKIHCSTGFNATLAHSDEDIERTSESATEVMVLIKRGIDAGNVDSLLECDVKKDPFRRLVR
jgi:hypothetical protein